MGKKPATYEDIVDAPDTKVSEIMGGELVVSPRPAIRHALATSELEGDLNGLFSKGRGGPGGWWILFEPELHFASDVLVPDITGWRRERMQLPPEDLPFLTLPPDWVCEVLSPSTEKVDRDRKMPIYAAVGVKHAWLLKPNARTLEVMRLEQGQWRLLATHAGDAIVRAEPFEAAEIDLLPLWGETRTPPVGR
jgi:Uma2 family endonuclease